MNHAIGFVADVWADLSGLAVGDADSFAAEERQEMLEEARQALRRAFRYAERLASHDVAFRQLATLRARFWARLEPLAPAGLPAFRRGDLLARLVGDVDTV